MLSFRDYLNYYQNLKEKHVSSWRWYWEILLRLPFLMYCNFFFSLNFLFVLCNMGRSGSFKFFRIIVWPLALVGVPFIHLFIHLLMYSFTKNSMFCIKKVNSCPQGSMWIKVSRTVWIKLWVNKSRLL